MKACEPIRGCRTVMFRHACFCALVTLGLALQGCASVHFGHPAKGCISSSQAAPVPVERIDSNLKVISWNLHGTPNVEMESRLKPISLELLKRKPDVILLQEVWFRGDADTLKELLGSSYARVQDGTAVNHGFLSALIGYRQGGLLAFLRKDHAPMEGDISSTFTLYKKYASKWRLNELDGISGKGIQEFQFRFHGRTIRLFNTHLQSQYPEHDKRTYDKIRGGQIDQLLKQATDQTQPDAVRLIFGDFNTMPDEFLYSDMTSGWNDLTSDLRATCNRCGTHLECNKKTKHVDELWLDYGLRGLRANEPAVATLASTPQLIKNQCPDFPFSDHQGLEYELVIKPGDAVANAATKDHQ